MICHLTLERWEKEKKKLVLLRIIDQWLSNNDNPWRSRKHCGPQIRVGLIEDQAMNELRAILVLKAK